LLAFLCLLNEATWFKLFYNCFTELELESNNSLKYCFFATLTTLLCNIIDINTI